MKCSDSMMKYTGYLHILALAVAIYGTYSQINAVKSGKAFSPTLAIALTVMLLLRIPNQIFLAHRVFHVLYSVFGTFMGGASFAYFGYKEYKASLKKKK